MISTRGAAPSSAHLFALYLDERMLRGLLATLEPAGGVEVPGNAEAHRSLFGFTAAADEAGTFRRPQGTDDLADLRPGDLVEVYGVTCGNPLLRVLTFVAAVMPLVDPLPSPGKARSGRTGAIRSDPEAEQVQRVLAGVVDAAATGLRSHAIIDVLMTSIGGLSVVLTLDRAILGSTGEALLEHRSVRVVGKVSSVFDPSRPVNLFRRCLLSATTARASRDMLADLADGGLELEMSDPIIEGPGVEILPLAVLI